MKTRTCRGRVISTALTTFGDQQGLLCSAGHCMG